MKKNLTTLVLMAGALLAVFFLTFRLHQTGEEKVLSQFNENQLLIAQQAAKQIESYFRSRFQDIQRLSSLASLHGPDEVRMAADIQSHFEHLKMIHVNDVSFFDENGTVAYSTTAGARGTNQSQADFFSWARAPGNKGSVRLGYQKMDEQQKPIDAGSLAPPHHYFSLVTPVYRESTSGTHRKPDGKFAGALMLVVDLEEMLADRSGLFTPAMKLHGLWIMDRYGTLLLHSEHPEMMGRTIRERDGTCNQCHVSFDYVEKILKEAQGVTEYRLKGDQRKVAAFASISFTSTAWIVVVNAPLDEVTAFVHTNFKETLFILGIVTFVLGLAFYSAYRNYRRNLDHETEVKVLRDRQKLMEELRETHDYLETLLGHANAPIVVWDQELKITRFNRAFERLTGYMAEEVIGNCLQILFPDTSREKLLVKIKSILSGEYGESIEIPILSKDGGIRTVLWTSANIYKKDGATLIATIAQGQDITEHKQMEGERQRGIERLRKALGRTVQAMAAVVETRDPYTAGHQRRVADLARAIATEMDLAPDQIEGIRTASAIHDIGKISIPADILSRPTKLSEIEFSLIEVHPQAGYDILKDIDFPWPVARMVLEHHERMNGSGYPQGLSGDKLLIESRIIAVADTVEAVASYRPHRPAFGIDRALDVISKDKGILYDQGVVDVCLKLFNEKGYKLAS